MTMQCLRDKQTERQGCCRTSGPVWMFNKCSNHEYPIRRLQCWKQPHRQLPVRVPWSRNVSMVLFGVSFGRQRLTEDAARTTAVDEVMFNDQRSMINGKWWMLNSVSRLRYSIRPLVTKEPCYKLHKRECMVKATTCHAVAKMLSLAHSKPWIRANRHPLQGAKKITLMHSLQMKIIPNITTGVKNSRCSRCLEHPKCLRHSKHPCSNAHDIQAHYTMNIQLQ